MQHDEGQSHHADTTQTVVAQPSSVAWAQSGAQVAYAFGYIAVMFVTSLLNPIISSALGIRWAGYAVVIAAQVAFLGACVYMFDRAWLKSAYQARELLRASLESKYGIALTDAAQVSISPGWQTPVAGGPDWDVGFLILVPDSMEFVGARSRFMLCPRQIIGSELGAMSPMGLTDHPRVDLVWVDDSLDGRNVVSIEVREGASLSAVWREARRLRARIQEWLQSPEPNPSRPDESLMLPPRNTNRNHRFLGTRRLRRDLAGCVVPLIALIWAVIAGFKYLYSRLGAIPDTALLLLLIVGSISALIGITYASAGVYPGLMSRLREHAFKSRWGIA